MYCRSCLDDAPRKFNIVAFLFLINLLKSNIRMPFGILSVKISVFAGSGFAFTVPLYLSLPGITGNPEKVFWFSG